MNFQPQVEAWCDEWAFAELAKTGFAQVDIDELLDPAPARAVRAMLDCMALALASARSGQGPITGLVVVPLPFVEDQLAPPTEHPTLAELMDRDWLYGPGLEVPGLYLLRGPEPVEADVEEYRIGLSPTASRYPAYYRAWRTLHDREHFPREWSRALYVRSAQTI